jgi:hypothetical protein
MPKVLSSRRRARSRIPASWSRMRLRVTGRSRLPSLAFAVLLLSATVVSAASAIPLAKRQPIPVRKWAPIGSGWSMRVIAVRPNVSPVAAGYGKPSAGEGVYVVTLALRYGGLRSDYIRSVLGDLELRGAHANYANAWACIRPWRRTGGVVRVASGRTVVGNVCFQDLTRDGPSMRLFAYPPGTGGLEPLPSPVEFSLR